MTKPSTRKKRNKLTIALLAPICIIIFIAGWSLYWIGQPRRPNTKPQQKPIKKAPAEQDQIELIVIPQQEKEILAN